MDRCGVDLIFFSFSSFCLFVCLFYSVTVADLTPVGPSWMIRKVEERSPRSSWDEENDNGSTIHITHFVSHSSSMQASYQRWSWCKSWTLVMDRYFQAPPNAWARVNDIIAPWFRVARTTLTLSKWRRNVLHWFTSHRKETEHICHR